MKLKFPNSTVDFEPTLSLFLGPFDIYDREETLGETLNKYDPLDPKQLQKLFNKYIFSRFDDKHGYTIEHRVLIVKSLIETLDDQHYDFSKYFPDYEDDDNYFYLPWTWSFPRPRYFFEQAYIAVVRHWGQEFEGYDMVLPEQQWLTRSKSS